MTARFGIDTPSLVRPGMGDPEDGFGGGVRKLISLIELDDARCGLLDRNLAKRRKPE